MTYCMSALHNCKTKRHRIEGVVYLKVISMLLVFRAAL